MPSIINSISEIDALYKLINSIKIDGTRNGPYQELQCCLLVIPFHDKKWKEFCNFRDKYFKSAGIKAIRGWIKATRVYTDMKDRHTKPSYLRRLVAYSDNPKRINSHMYPVTIKKGGLIEINQLNKIQNDLTKRPGLSNLSFVVFRPSDLFDQIRPGYVPCPIAGDFKLRDGLLHLSVMFRTMDAISVSFADIYYFRKMQLAMINKIRKSNQKASLKNIKPGNLQFFLTRAFIDRKFFKQANQIGSKKTSERDKFVDSILNTLLGQLNRNPFQL